jgi:hypothetical protein
LEEDIATQCDDGECDDIWPIICNAKEIK